MDQGFLQDSEVARRLILSHELRANALNIHTSPGTVFALKSSMKKILGLLIMTGLALPAFAQIDDMVNYPMLVVREARVKAKNKNLNPGLSSVLRCHETNHLTASETQISWEGPESQIPQLMLTLSETQKIYGVMNSDEGLMNFAAYWLEVKNGAKTLYYKLGQLDVEMYEIPALQLLNQQAFAISTEILTPDPAHNGSLIAEKIPLVPTRYYEEVLLQKRTDQILQIKKRTCQP